MSLKSLLVCTAGLFAILVPGARVGLAAADAKTEYLSDLRHRFLHVQQGWGELGINTCAHGGGAPAQPLLVAGQQYAKGLGHHAPGEIIVELGGEYARFEAKVGIQTQTAGTGTVAFKVFADDALRFDSGVMNQEAEPKAVSVDVMGAEEMRLVVTDGGDGIVCDCANWLEARLVRAERAASRQPGEVLDVAPFGEVMTSDPKRMGGARSNRVQEYRAEDIYMETPAWPDAAGVYALQGSRESPACIGLKWLERRRIREAGLELASAADAEKACQAQVQVWVGESAWQGGWKPIAGEWTSESAVCLFRPDWAGVPEARSLTRKIRFILPTPIAIRRFIAVTPTPLKEAALRVELEKPLGSEPASIRMYNGELIGTNDARAIDWAQDQPLSIKVRYSKPRPWMSDRTSLRFRLPGAQRGLFAVSVDDVLENGCVYVRDFGLFITTDPPKTTLAEYKKQVAERRTVLQEVRTKPDQTFAQATAAIHNPKQNLQPTLLSLACDNHKMVAHRNGDLQFSSVPETDDQHVSDLLDLSGKIATKFGSGKNEKLTRTMDGEWMPIPVVSVDENGVIYRQRTFVAPLGKDKPGSTGVMELTVENTSSGPADASVELGIWANAAKDDVAEMTGVPTGAVAFRKGRLVAYVQAVEVKPLKLELRENGVRLGGNLPPRATSRLVVFIPTATIKPEQHTQLPRSDELLRLTKEHWVAQLAPAMQVEVPDPLLANVIKASQVHCLVAARNEASGSRVAAWIGSVSYGPLESEAHSVIRGMDSLGHHEFARKSLEFFVGRYNKDGFLTTGYTVMGTGWHLWTLGQHYRLVQDKAWLEKVAPEVRRVCDWVVRQRQKTMKTLPDETRPPEYGLMPPGIMADWNAFAYYFCLNGYFATGLQAAADALADVGVTEAANWKEQAGQFVQDVLRGYEWTQAMMPVYRLRDGTSVPGYPSQLHGPGPTGNFFPGEDGNRSWCYDVELGSHHLIPFGIIPADSREATWMMDHMEDVQFLSEGWFDFPAERSAKDPFNYGGFAKVQPYYCRNGEINAMRDDVKPFVRTYFNALVSLLNYENLSLQEHFAGVAAWNKTHETGYFLHQTSLMMAMDRGDELWLAPFVTNNWMKDGQTVAATNAPTVFGPVSFRITSSAGQGYIEATIEPPGRRAPRQIVLRLRHPEGKPMQKVTVNGGAHDDFDAAREIIHLAPGGGKMTVRASY